MPNPIQVVLNPEKFHESRKAPGGGNRKDFFAHRDKQFALHKQEVMQQIKTISDNLSQQSQGEIGYIKVSLKREAWAKSHRPTRKLFRPDRTPVVGGGDIGVMIIKGNPTNLR